MDQPGKTLEGNEAQESIGLKTAATPASTTDSSDEESLEVVPSDGPSQPSRTAETRGAGRRERREGMGRGDATRRTARGKL
jgi:hypothetical protein